MSLPDLIRSKISHLSKRELFLIILALAAAAAGLVSAILYATVLDASGRRPLRIAVVAPGSGRSQAQGESIRRGVELYVHQVNKAGGLAGHPLAVVTFDDGDDPEKARAAAEDAARSDVIGVVGHFSGEVALAAAEVYARHGIPALTPGAGPAEPLPETPWLFRTTFDETFETRFLANYVRNVLGEKTVSIIHTGSARDEHLSTVFDEVLQRFGTKVLFRWAYDPSDANVGVRLQAVADDIKDKKLTGAILVLGDAEGAAQVVATLRQAGVRNKVAGLRNLATAAFVSSLAAHWNVEASVPSALNGTIVTAPMLFDTAGELAQNFRHGYVTSYGDAPDWLAGYAYDGARLLVDAYRGLSAAARQSPGRPIRDHLAAISKVTNSFAGINGPLFFDAKGVSTQPAWVGQYDGTELISALIQLSPIREEGVTNYLQELMAGRALYVNDRFMYKTNVVYAGVKIDKVSALDTKSSTVDLDFIVWFRWRGNIQPEDVVFTNAVTPIKLEKPEREGQDGDMLYRAYRVRGKFFLKSSSVSRAYGSELVGIAFHHRLLNRNNLMYVSDVLGMDLGSAATLSDNLRKTRLAISEGADGLTLKRLADMVTGGDVNVEPLVDAMLRARVLAGLSGWSIERAWVSQEVSRQNSGGDPAFVGFGKPQPAFSVIDVGLLLKPDAIKARDLFPTSSFLYIAVFSLVGALVASLLDRKDRGQFWRIQTLGLRTVSWPLLLVSVGNLILDYAIQNFATSVIDVIVFCYESLWWLGAARIVGISLERFIWGPVEVRSGRKIPNVVRLLSSVSIYALALCGVVAFVMGQTLTSVLATSGVLAMIIGLAVQANISNVFSGIVLNLERPFKIGDYVSIGNTVGQIKDITWRTIRIRVDGHTVSLPNGKVSEAEVHTYSIGRAANTGLVVHVDPQYAPERVTKLLRECMAATKEIVAPGSPDLDSDSETSVYFAGIENASGFWVARYNLRFSVRHMGRLKHARNELWQRVWSAFASEGIEWRGVPDPSPPPPVKA